MHNDPPTLSPAAQSELTRLERATIEGDWIENYMTMLKRLVERDTDDVTDWEVKGQGIEVLEHSREQHRVAVELRAYAKTQIPRDISAALAKLPESASLSDFLDRLMQGRMGKEPVMKRFVEFLTHEAVSCVDEQMALHPHPLTRDEYVASMVRARLKDLEHADLPQELQYYTQEAYRAWWKTQSDGGIAECSRTRKEIMQARHADLLALLPSRPDEAGMTKKKWESLAVSRALVDSDRTFRRDVEKLIGKKMVQRQADGNFRQAAKIKR